MLTLTVKNNRRGPILGRHPWVFSGGLKQIPNQIENGTPVKLVDEAKQFLAQGYFNSYSQIAVRIWSYDPEEIIDEDFFLRRVQKAYKLRQEYLAPNKTDSYRLINSENDWLPGLIVDKYANYLCVQFHTKGIEKYKPDIISALIKIMKPKGIYERSDALYRKTEGAEPQVGLIDGVIPDAVEIKENGHKFLVDIKGGQKTGFFLDQRDKRQALAKYCAGKKVLNCFSYSGGFSVYAALAGAKEVTSVDISASAIELAKANFKLNGINPSKHKFVVADVKQYLREVLPWEYDVVVLDPPAFIKNRHKKKEGISGYRSINEMGLRATKENGILVSCSCSAHLTLNEFRYVITEAGNRAQRNLQILETHTHGLDHLELIAFQESEYLKCLFLRVS